MDNNEKEIEMIYYLNILWKKKWLIIIPTILCVIAAGIISFVLPPEWEVDTIIQPGKFFIQTEDGATREVIFVQPTQIESQINQESYNHIIAAELNLDIRKFPKLRAENIRDTYLVLTSLRTQDVEKAKSILQSLNHHLKNDLDKKVEVEIKATDTKIATNENLIKQNELTIEDKLNEIKLNEIKKNKTKQKIGAAENKHEISIERENSISEEKKAVKKRIDEIEMQLKETLAEKKEETGALSLLLYSNEVQNNLRYLNTLDKDLNNEKVRQEDLDLDIKTGKEEIKELDTQNEMLRNETEKIKTRMDSLRAETDFLNEKKALIDYAQVIKEPTPSITPVYPQKMLIVLIAGIFSLLIFTMFSFFLEYIQKHRPNN